MTLKKRLREMLQRGDFDALAGTAGGKRRSLGILVSLTFDTDPLVAWRAIEGMGAAASRIADDDPEYVREHLRRLNWLMSEESGAVCWRAPEAMAEIVRRRPELFADFIPIVALFIVNLAEEDLNHFRAGALWAVGRLGTIAGNHINEALPAITSALTDPDAQVRGMAVWCLGQVDQARRLSDYPDLLSDEGTVELYENGSLSSMSVCEMARKELTK